MNCFYGEYIYTNIVFTKLEWYEGQIIIIIIKYV